MAKLEKMGVKFVKDVDKSGFQKIAEPIQDKTAAALGPHAVELLKLVHEVK
jgi:TRAP-type C4-dicarboxylate transport system substrate-binding protein